jgi:hypothetical protein
VDQSFTKKNLHRAVESIERIDGSQSAIADLTLEFNEGAYASASQALRIPPRSFTSTYLI